MIGKTCSLVVILSSLLLVLGQTTPDSRTGSDDSCRASTKYKLMSSKTSYVLVANEDAKKEFQMPKCEQVGLWHLSRHGQRFPDGEEIEDINESLGKFRDRILSESTSTWLCEKDKRALRKWTPKMTAEDGHLLTADGIRIMKQLGARMKNRLDDLIAKLRSSPDRVKVRATNITRTIQSSKAYLDGLYGNWPKRPVLTVQQDSTDYLLKFPDICAKYIEEIDSNSAACSESSNFELLSSEYISELNAFGQRFGLPLFSTERKKLLNLALKACQYEYLIDGTDSIWCKFFPKNFLRLIEYREDLKYQCKYGYKYNISRDMTCDLVSDLLSSLMDLKSENPNKTLASLYFTHSSTMLPFLASMGLYNQKTDFDFASITTINENRTYRTSRIDPMNSNVAFVVYKCSNNIAPGSQYRVKVFHNENVVIPNGCKSGSSCDLDEFILFHQTFTNRCTSSQSVCKL